jgi:uroporphyrinogen III methyltransferase/synthase
VVGEVVRLREELAWFDHANQKPLLGQNIVVTRAREQASSLVEGLENWGAQVLQCPTIRIEKLSDAEYSPLDGAIENLADFDWIVFASRNGVEHFWQRLRFHQKDARALSHAQVAAIGPATQEALEAHGICPDFVPESSISESVAEGLLKFSPRKILLVRAAAGRDVMQNTWREAGAQVTLAPAYRTVPDHSNAETVREKIATGAINWVTFTSSSTVANFVDAIGAGVLQANRGKFRVACIGPITEKTACENRLTPDVVAPQASVESLVQALVEVIDAAE